MQTQETFNTLAADERWDNRECATTLAGPDARASQARPRPAATAPAQAAASAPTPAPRRRAAEKNGKNAKKGELRNSGDSLLGSLLVASFLGVHFGDAVADALDVPEPLRGVDVGMAVEVYDEYNRDRHNNRATADDLPQSWQMRQGQALNAFNDNAPNRPPRQTAHSAPAQTIGQMEKDWATREAEQLHRWRITARQHGPTLAA